MVTIVRMGKGEEGEERLVVVGQGTVLVGTI